jgi:hypothetical protein
MFVKRTASTNENGYISAEPTEDIKIKKNYEIQ